MALLAALGRLLLLPGRLLIRTIDDLKRSNGVPPLGRFLRGCVHGFLGLFALMAFAMSTAPPPAPVAAPIVRTAPSYVPLQRPTGILSTTAAPSSTPPSTAVDEPDDPVYVPLPDDDDNWDKPRICHRKWWC